MFALRADFPNPWIGNTDPTKSAQSPRIINMNSQLFISESVQLFNNCRPQHLVGTHSLCPGILFSNLSFVEILNEHSHKW